MIEQIIFILIELSEVLTMNDSIGINYVVELKETMTMGDKLG